MSIQFTWRSMIWTAALSALTAMAVAQGKGQAGWQELFDGHSLQGWKHVGPGSFEVKDGMLVSSGGMGLLYWSGGPVSRCELRVVYRMQHENDNSGVFIRIPQEPTEPWMPVHKGFEVQIDNKADEYHRTGTLYSFTKAMSSPGKPGPQWNTMTVTIDGPRTIVVVNGAKVTDFTQTPDFTPPPRTHDWEPVRGPRPDAGWIGLQNHSDNDVVEFKEVALRKLD
jgi:Domain of Unknown Function (DUF1080)